MVGAIVVNRYDLTNQFQAEALKQSFEKFGVHTSIVKNSFDLAYFIDNKVVSTLDVDFVVFLDKDILMSKLLEEVGIRVFNSSKCLAICDDKLLTSIYLSRKNINIPATYSLPLEYRLQEEFIQTIDFPYILKENKSSLGEGVYLINSEEDFIEAKKTIGTKRAIVQEYISSSYGHDFRVIILGGKFLSAMERINKSNFKSNISKGGIGYPCKLSDEYVEIAIQAANAVGADYCGVDILIGENNIPIICEVNSNALFAHIGKVTDVDISYKYAKYIIEQCKC